MQIFYLFVIKIIIDTVMCLINILLEMNLRVGTFVIISKIISNKEKIFN